MHLRIDIESGSEPIRGVVRFPEDPEAIAFCGWIELTSLIEAAHRTPSHDRPHEGEGHRE